MKQHLVVDAVVMEEALVSSVSQQALWHAALQACVKDAEDRISDMVDPSSLAAITIRVKVE